MPPPKLTLVNNIQNQAEQIIKNMNAINTIILTLTIVIAIIVFIWFYNTLKLSNTNCSNLEKIYGKNYRENLNINNINDSNPIYKDLLVNYYVKTAYNCCCPGNFKNDFVDSEYTNPEYCALTTCIHQGARCLDFEIYSEDNKPVIAASSVDSVNIKETFNYLDFEKAMHWTSIIAYSSSETTNYTDPLILNLRIMSNNKLIYPLIAGSISKNFNTHLLDAQYNIMNYCSNLASLPLLDFKNKVLIIIDHNTFNNLVSFCPIIGSQNCPKSKQPAAPPPVVPSPTKSKCQTPNLLEVVNMHSGSPYINTIRVSDLKANSDIKGLKNLNKTTMTILLPNFTNNALNFDSSLGFQTGCQLIGMSFQNFDANMEFYTEFFNKAGSSFALKSETLRFVQKYVTLPPPLPKYIDVSPKTHSLDTSAGPLLNITFPQLPQNDT